MQLVPGETHDTLRVQLRVIQQSEPHDYDALSYVWGQGNSATPAVIDGVEVTIPSNLEAALHRFRTRDQPCTMWVDAICINQQDV